MTPTRYEAGAGQDARISSLEVVVLHTTVPATLRALRTAAGLAHGLGVRIRLLVPQLVPFLPLDVPPIARDFLERRFQAVASDVEVETRIDIRLCRDQWAALQSALRPHSLVVLGGRSFWWPSAEKRLAQRLRSREISEGEFFAGFRLAFFTPWNQLESSLSP